MPNYWFDHVQLVSPDPQKTADFYENTFGAKKNSSVDLPDGRTLRAVSIDGILINATSPRAKPLAPNTLPGGCGLEHFGLGTDNLIEAVAELKAIGLECAQEITAVSPTSRVAFFISPDNVLIELKEVSS